MSVSDLILFSTGPYILGSISGAYVLGRMIKGVDLRLLGTKTLGISNASKHLGFWAIPALVFWDVGCKGILPIWITRFVFGHSEEVQALVGICTILGHNWPVFLKFHGGRGIATVYGITLSLYPFNLPLEFVVLGITSLIGKRLFTDGAVGTLIGVTLLPIVSLFWGRSISIIAMMLGILVLVLVKRLLGNSIPHLGREVNLKVMLNRLVYDRDIASKKDWIRGEHNASGS